MSAIEVKVPDIGDFKDVPVIELFVKPGDAVKADDSLVTLESDKATMDVPAPTAGVIQALKVKVGDKVSEGSVILTLETNGAGKPAPAASAPSPQPAPARASVDKSGSGEAARESGAPTQKAASAPSSGGGVQEIKVPDIGDFTDVPVIEVFVKPGATVAVDDPLVTLESDKATMDVPSPVAGVVKDVNVKVGDKVSEGSVILTVESAAGQSAQTQSTATPAAPATGAAPAPPAAAAAVPAVAATAATAAPAASPEGAPDPAAFKLTHASPSVRVFARELGVDLSKITGTGPKGRILHDDVQQFVKRAMSGAGAAPVAPGGGLTGGGALNLLPWPKVDFAKFGPVEAKPLSRIKKISGANLARNWVMIPHVTQFDDADITELEAFRVQLNKENEKSGVKVTMLAFLIKASVAALRKFPDFNASLDGDNLVYKRYFNVGFAADTPNGLVVPVIKSADQKGVLQIAKEMGDLSAKAREGKLGPADMQGGCFSISSLGGIGGTAFTPIINAPEVAILGVSKSATKPVWNGKEFAPRLVLPMSLSYDHRVIDGAAAARFSAYLAQLLADLRRVML
jgi:pyruvate dehydrogenase E2 component (dihydrolipoyllysine-residue acetyltransferase)